MNRRTIFGVTLAVVLLLSYILFFEVKVPVANAVETTWSTETIDSSGNVGLYASLAFNSEGNPGISYYDNTNGNLKYAAFQDSIWSTATLGSTGTAGPGAYTSLAFLAGYPSISYFNSTNGDLKYTKINQSPFPFWSNSTVDSTGWVGACSSLAFNSTGNPCISYL